MSFKNVFNVLIIGQIPPPYHGQSVMIKKILEAEHSEISMNFIRMDYSTEIDKVGKFDLRKITKLFQLIYKAKALIKKQNIDAIYYPPAGTGLIPITRDIITLLFLRNKEIKLIFHFHAMGLKSVYQKAKPILKFFMNKAYLYPELCICISEFNKEEIQFLYPKKVAVVNYGSGLVPLESIKKNNENVTILFTGNIILSKGILILLNVAEKLHAKGYKIKINFMGGMTSQDIEKQVLNHVSVKKNIANFIGVQTGKKKMKTFQEADIFCFPTFYENENFPVVIIEAMQAGLPIISSRWRGIPSMIQNGVNGFLISPRSEEELEDKI
ncbi:MAG: glycosyltransferase family 4 protein, partial [Balneolaceae bacterium]